MAGFGRGLDLPFPRSHLSFHGCLRGGTPLPLCRCQNIDNKHLIFEICRKNVILKEL